MDAKVKCLVVDDLEENLLAMTALLRQEDVEVLACRSGTDALELLLLHDVALAFLDVQMPEMDGFQLAELMRGSDRTRHIPIIFVTAGARDQYRIFKGYEAGAVDFLHKPVEAHILRNKAAVFFQLYRQKQQLAQDLRERSETLRLNEMFSAVLGHDLRNPLHAILLSAEVLLRTARDDVVRQTATRIQSSSKRMHRMIEDLLDLARLRLAQGIPLKRAPVDLGALVVPVLQEHRAACPGLRIELSQTGDLAGDWDADRLAQVISNLIANAVQHGDEGTIIEVGLDGSRREEVELSVANRGTIPENLMPVLFDPFRGRERQTGRGGGLGLGLYIVQQIVHSHQGTIDVSSSGGLTVFRARMPRAADAA